MNTNSTHHRHSRLDSGAIRETEPNCQAARGVEKARAPQVPEKVVTSRRTALLRQRFQPFRAGFRSSLSHRKPSSRPEKAKSPATAAKESWRLTLWAA